MSRHGLRPNRYPVEIRKDLALIVRTNGSRLATEPIRRNSSQPTEDTIPDERAKRGGRSNERPSQFRFAPMGVLPVVEREASYLLQISASSESYSAMRRPNLPVQGPRKQRDAPQIDPSCYSDLSGRPRPFSIPRS